MLKAFLIAVFVVIPVTASALPVGLFFAGLAGVPGAAVIAGAGAFGSAVFAVGTWLGGSILGSILLNVGLAYLLRPDQPSGQPIDAARVNSRLANAPRWQAGGFVAVGGEAGIFAEHDENGNLWYIVAHADSELTGSPTYLLDNIEVTLSDGTDGFTAGDVLTDAFCLTSKHNQYEGSGTKVPYIRLYTVTPDSSNVYGAKPNEFTAAFPNLPSDFYLAGVSYTIVRCRSQKPQHRSKAYHWRGPIGLGEPSISVYANFSRMYDPREAGHNIDDPTTWTPSDGNSAIVWAWWRTTPYGRNRPMNEINWTKVAEQSDICDLPKLDRTGTPIPSFRCGVAFPDNKPRHKCEGEILLSCDGFVVYDDEGKAWPRVGVYEIPTLTFTGERDILSAQTQIIDDGESAVDGVVVNYISPNHGYTKQPSAPWQNTNYYDGSSEPNYLTIDVLACQNHNQAVRLAKAMGLRAAATRRAVLQTTIKGILAKGVRTITVSYDDNFDGAFEIASPISEGAGGIDCLFSVVPMQTDRYDLNDGEEGIPPALAPALNIDDSLSIASNVVVTAESVATANGVAVRLAATFDAPTRVDRFYRFRYAEYGTFVYEYFSVDMDEAKAYSAIVVDGQVYDVQWQTVTAGGRATEWSSITSIPAIANQNPPSDLISASATGGSGQAVVDFVTANDVNQKSVAIYQNSAVDFGASTRITTVVAGANIANDATIIGLAPGTYYFWAVPLNGSGVPGNEDGPHTAVIT